MPIIALLPCPYLETEVELTDEREAHLSLGHPEFYPQHAALISATLEEPDFIAQDALRRDTLLFLRWYPALEGGKYVLVAVVCHAPRYWIVTAFMLDEEKEHVIWRRS